MAERTYTSSNNNAPTPTQGSGGVKYRIYQDDKIKPTIELDELSLPSSENSASENVENLASLRYPLIKINDYMLSSNEIQVMEIKSDGFLPSIMLKATFIHQTFLSREMPKDGDIISVAIRNKSDMLKSIRNDYVITSVVSSQNVTSMTGPTTMTFFGNLFIPLLSSAKGNLSFEGTSMGAVKDIAKKLGLGFATNEDNTNDKQVWISASSTPLDYIKKTVERSWRDDDSFYDVWIDIYYNLNFVNVNKQLMSAEDKIDVAAWMNNIDKDYTWGSKLEQDTVREAPKVLSNYKAYRTTPFYINTWRPINRSTNITFQIGSKMNCNMFEHNQSLYNTEGSQKYWQLSLEPAYDPNKVNKYILLRGRATQDPDKRGKDLARANYSYPDMYVKNPWMGIQYTISNPDADNLQWDGNHHKNYLRSKLQNLINNKELEKLNVEVLVNGMNLNLIQGDKTPIVLIKSDVVENLMVSPNAGTDDILEQFYSGWFYIKGFSIKYTHENDESIMSNFTQSFILTRREWPPPIAVDAIPSDEDIQNNNTE